MLPLGSLNSEDPKLFVVVQTISSRHGNDVIHMRTKFHLHGVPEAICCSNHIGLSWKLCNTHACVPSFISMCATVIKFEEKCHRLFVVVQLSWKHVVVKEMM